MSLQLALNPGGLFGMGGGHTEAFVAFSLLTMSLVIWMFFSFGHAHWLPRLALGMVLGGAIGNLWDRIVYKRVRDFVLVYIGSYRWPNFNVADTWICVGVCVLVLWLWMNPEATGKEDTAPAEAADEPGRHTGRKRRKRSKRKN